MWDLPRPGLEPVSPASAGRFSTTVPPGKPPLNLLSVLVYVLQLAVVNTKVKYKVNIELLISLFLSGIIFD